MVRPSAPPCLSVSVVKFANVRKCPVLSGLLNAIPVTIINPLFQQDLHQFPSPSRPDIPDIRPIPRPFSSLLSDIPQCPDIRTKNGYAPSQVPCTVV